MGTCTALILVGGRHIYEGGISPRYALFLWENGRIAWELRSLYRSGLIDINKVWICRWEDLLNDAILMIALYVLKSKNILNFFKKKGLLETEHIDIYSIFSQEDRKKLYSECSQIDWNGLKLTMILFRTSSLFHRTMEPLLQGNQVQLHKYRNMNFEICFPFYEKYWDVFQKRYSIWKLQDEINKINSDFCF